MAKLCKKCGALLDKNDHTCPKCGDGDERRSTAPTAETKTAAKSDRAGSTSKKKPTISEKKERKAKKAAANRRIFIMVIVDLVLLLLVLAGAAFILDILGIINIPFLG